MGRSHSVVLSYGGALGIGGKLFAVPWDQIRFTAKDQPLIVNVSKDRLDRLEGFNKENWPAQPDFAAFEPERSETA